MQIDHNILVKEINLPAKLDINEYQKNLLMKKILVLLGLHNENPHHINPPIYVPNYMLDEYSNIEWELKIGIPSHNLGFLNPAKKKYI